MMLLVAGAFVGTFLVVCLIAYLLLSKRGGDPKRAPARRVARATPAHVGYGPRPAADVGDNVRKPSPHTLRDGAVLAYRLLQWFRDGPPDRGAVEPPVTRGPTTARTLAAAVAALGVGVLVFLGVIAIGLKVFEYGFKPILDAISGPLFHLLLVPGVLPALALAVLAIGLPLSRKFRPQGLFVTGLFAVALGFLCLWQLPKLMAALPTPEARVELEAPLLIVGLIVSGFLLVCGFQLMGNCKWVRGQEAGGDNE